MYTNDGDGDHKRRKRGGDGRIAGMMDAIMAKIREREREKEEWLRKIAAQQARLRALGVEVPPWLWESGGPGAPTPTLAGEVRGGDGNGAVPRGRGQTAPISWVGRRESENVKSERSEKSEKRKSLDALAPSLVAGPNTQAETPGTSDRSGRGEGQHTVSPDEPEKEMPDRMTTPSGTQGSRQASEPSISLSLAVDNLRPVEPPPSNDGMVMWKWARGRRVACEEER